MTEQKEEPRESVGEWWRRLPLRRKVGLLSTLPTVFLAFYTLGFMVGRWHSPDYNSIDQAKAFVARELLIHELTTTEVRMSVSAGTREVFYSLAGNQLDHREFSLDVLEQLPKTTRDTAFEAEELAKLAGVLGIGAVLPDFKTTLAAVMRGRTQQVVPKGGTAYNKVLVFTALAVAAFGGGLGYERGYKDEPNFESEAFRSVLANKDQWHQWAQALQECAVLFPERVGAGLPPRAAGLKREQNEANCDRRFEYARRHRE